MTTYELRTLLQTADMGVSRNDTMNVCWAILFFIPFLFVILFAGTGLCHADNDRNVGSPFGAIVSHPVYEDIERVYVAVRYSGITEIEREIYDPILTTENTIRVIVDGVREMFRPEWCSKHKVTEYECKNQPVALVPKSDFHRFLTWETTPTATREELREKGTLILVFDLDIFRNTTYFDPPLKTPVLLMQRHTIRLDKDIPKGLSLPSMSLTPLNQNHEKLQQRLNVLAWRIS
ncbi:MAG: hypothetical protein H6856_02125 [Rhodospirillales bacterium]|nr:hypothetical protein [Rhodospirillales bacterium]